MDDTYRYRRHRLRGTGGPLRKNGRKPELTSAEEKQKLEADANSLKRFNESESASSDLSSDLIPEEQSEKPRKLTKVQKDKIAEYRREETCSTTLVGKVS